MQSAPRTDPESLDFEIVQSQEEVMADSSSASKSGVNCSHLTSIVLSESGRNYLSWAPVVTLLLQNQDKAWECTQGKLALTDPDYDKANLKAKTILFNSISPALIATKFANTATDVAASDMWKIIKARYADTSNTAKDTALAEFFAFRFDPSKSVITNMDRFQQVMQRVTLSGTALDEKVCCRRLLHMLPKTWESLRMFWSVKSSSDQTLSNLYTLIQGEAARRDHENRDYDPSVHLSQLSIRGGRRFPNNNRGYRRFRPSFNRAMTAPGFAAVNGRHPQSGNYSRYNSRNNSNFQTPVDRRTNGNRDFNQNHSNPRFSNNRPTNNRRGRPNEPRRNTGRRHPTANVAEATESFANEVEIFLSDINTESENTETWLVDSGASHNIARNIAYMQNYTAYKQPRLVKLGGDQLLEALGEGEVVLEVHTPEGSLELELSRVLHVPQMRRNLISMASLMLDNWQIQASRTQLRLSRGLATLEIPVDRGLFALRATPVTVPAECLHIFSSHKTISLQRFHEVLGHVNVRQVKEFLTREGIPFTGNQINCAACIQGKLNRVSYHSKPSSAKPQSLGYLTTDICGRMGTTALGGFEYFMNIQDRYSRFNKIYLLKTRDEAPELI